MKRLFFYLLIIGPLILEATPLQIETFDLGIANVHYVRQGNTGMLIDSGEPGTVAKLLKKMERKGIDAEMVDFILLTHGHADHAGGAAELARTLDAQIIAGKPENGLLERGCNPPLQATSSLGEWVDKHIVKEDSFPPVQADHWVESTLDLQTWGLPGEIWLAPGHTGGSLVYVVGESAFVGDLIRGALILGKRPRRHFFHEDIDQAEAHLQHLLDSGVNRFYCGHKGYLTAKSVRRFISQITSQS